MQRATAVFWAGLRLYQLTSLRLQWPFLLCIKCFWFQNQCKWRGNKATTLRCRPRQSPKSQLQTGEQRGSSVRACLATALRSQQHCGEGHALAQVAEMGSEHGSRQGDA